MNIVNVMQTPSLENYQLKENNNIVLKVSFRSRLQIARIDTKNERRVLIIEDVGLLHSKVIINNEYGIRIGALAYDNFSSSHGSVEIEGTRFRFVMKQVQQPELNIYKGSRSNLVYACRLTPDENDLRAIPSRPSAFITGVAWYLFLKTSHEELVLDEAIIL